MNNVDVVAFGVVVIEFTSRQTYSHHIFLTNQGKIENNIKPQVARNLVI